jgi:DNA-directed RNA polymerase alpha subunit
LDRIDAWMAEPREVLHKGTAATVTDPPMHGSCTVPAGSVPIDQLELRTIRTYNSLKRAGISTVDQLVTLTAADLLQLRQFGASSLADVGEALAKMGLSLSTLKP